MTENTEIKLSIKAFIGLISTIVVSMLGLFLMFYNSLSNDIEQKNEHFNKSLNEIRTEIKAELKSTQIQVDLVKENQIKTNAYMEIILNRVTRNSPNTAGSGDNGE